MRKVFIYTITDPRTGDIRYIGKTVNVNYRLCRHKYSAKKSTKSHKDAWIKGILNSGLSPVLDVIDECSEDDWKQTEIYWIAQFKCWGFNLLNETIGGEGTTLIGKSKTRKAIYEYTKDGIFIERFNDFTELKVKYPTFARQAVQACCIGDLKTYKKKIFLYDTNIDYRLSFLGRQAVRLGLRLAIKQANLK